jgi:hypothetical protein
MKQKRSLIYLSLFLFPMIAGVVLLDLAGSLNYSDIPFLLTFSLYGIFIIIQRSHSNLTFRLAIFLLMYAGLSYIPVGAARTTERISEWFYLFFVFGLMQYMKEIWFPK